jgi:hypothetical protein
VLDRRHGKEERFSSTFMPLGDEKFSIFTGEKKFSAKSPSPTSFGLPLPFTVSPFLLAPRGRFSLSFFLTESSSGNLALNDMKMPVSRRESAS